MNTGEGKRNIRREGYTGEGNRNIRREVSKGEEKGIQEKLLYIIQHLFHEDLNKQQRKRILE